MKILFVAPISLHKDASAGAETINYYIKELTKIGHEITAISRDKAAESQLLELNILIGFDSNIDLFLYKVKKILGWIFYPQHKYLFKSTRKTINRVFTKTKALKKSGYVPDIIILETTTAILWVDFFRYLFPKANLVASVHDVAYQGSWRRLLLENNLIKKKLRERYIEKAKTIEVAALAKMSLIVPQNNENTKLLNENVELRTKKYCLIAPYYSYGFNHLDDTDSKNIIFFGLMNRPENYLSIQWFIENVIPFLSEEFTLTIIGGNPPKTLLAEQSERIIVTGFISSMQVKDYFETSFCLVCPLLFGSGIKTKVLSALATGIPILTNDIGIEGINAESGKDYIHCADAKDYIEGIKMLSADKRKYLQICNSARKMMRSNYNLTENADKYEKALKNL